MQIPTLNTLYSTYPKSKTTSLKRQAPSNYAFIILKMVIKWLLQDSI